MKVFIVKFKNPWNHTAFLEAPDKTTAIAWLTENCPANTKIIEIKEGQRGELNNIKTIFQK